MVEKVCYNDDEWYCDNGFGGMYTWSEAMNIPQKNTTQLLLKNWIRHILIMANILIATFREYARRIGVLWKKMSGVFGEAVPWLIQELFGMDRSITDSRFFQCCY